MRKNICADVKTQLQPLSSKDYTKVKPEEKSPLGRPGRRWKDDNKIDLREIALCGMDWVDLA
jgi:hypothetical protein